MQFRIEQNFSNPIDAVQGALLDPDFLTCLAQLPNLGRPSLLDQHVDGTTVRQRVRYAFVGHLSGAVRAVVDPERLTWVEVSRTDRANHRASFAIEPDHYAGLLRCKGEFVLSATPAGCQRIANGELTVSVPLVGRRVEGAIVSGMTEHARLEADALDGWLNSR